MTSCLPQIVPLLSQSSHPLPSGFAKEELDKLTNRIQFGGDEVVKAKDGAGSATLSMAYAGVEFANKIIRAVKGEKGIVAPTFVNLIADKEGGEALKKELDTDLDYFSAPVELGVRSYDLYTLQRLMSAFSAQPEGVVSIKSVGKITDFEAGLIKAAIPELKTNIEKVAYTTLHRIFRD